MHDKLGCCSWRPDNGSCLWRNTPVVVRIVREIQSDRGCGGKRFSSKLRKSGRNWKIDLPCFQGRIKGGKGAITTGNYMLWIKYSFEKLWFRIDTKIQIYIRCCIKYHYWFLYRFDVLPVLVITTEYNYFQFCLMQICLNFASNVFPVIVLLAWVCLSTCASRLLHKCRESDIICMLKLVLWLLFSINDFVTYCDVWR